MRYRNARYIDHDRIDCEIEHPTYGWIPFTCDPADAGAGVNVTELHSRMSSDPETRAYVPPSPEEVLAKKSAEVRARRDFILQSEVDPVVTNPLRWSELTSEEQSSWISYRRALLDIPSQSGFPHAVVWPVRQITQTTVSETSSRW